MSYKITNPKTGRQVNSDGEIGQKLIKEFETFLEKATKLAESTEKSPTKGSKNSPKKLTETSAKELIAHYKEKIKNDKKKDKSDLVNKSKTVISDLIRYLKKINVPGFVIVDFVLMPEDISLKETNDLLKSYELIIEGLEHMVLNPPEDD